MSPYVVFDDSIRLDMRHPRAMRCFVCNNHLADCACPRNNPIRRDPVTHDLTLPKAPVGLSVGTDLAHG